jgi:type IV secretory pathway VirB9-like protein
MNHSRNPWRRSFLLHFLSLFTLSAAAFASSPARAATEVAARVVKYAKEDIVPVHAKLRFSTLIVLPDDEEILDFTTGDKEFWIINGVHNLCYVHPAQTGIRSNLNLITASGRVYSFLLVEISNQPTAEPDLKLFVEPKEGRVLLRTAGSAATSVRAKRKPTRKNWKLSAPRPPSRFAQRKRNPPSK